MELKEEYLSFLKNLPLDNLQECSEKLTAYTELLFNERKVRNIIGPSDIKTIVYDHIMPSACLSLTVKQNRGADIGSGAGLPGLVAGILFPGKIITLLEPKKTRVNFLNKVINDLELKNISIAPYRAEIAGRKKEYRGKFGFSFCRAVADLKITAELALPLLKKGGIYYAQKGQKLEEELKEANKIIRDLGGKVETVRREENTVLIRKIAGTPLKYPRKWKKIIS